LNSTDYPPHRSGSLAASATSLKSVDIPLECVPGPGSKAAGLPEKIGKYRVLDQIGTGSTSDVFLCHDDFQDRTVAIKRIKPALPGDGPHSGVHSFAAEAALVGKLNHPYVVKLLDAVDDRAGPYLVMEYVAGSTLRAHCRPDQLLPLEQIMELSFKCAMVKLPTSKFLILAAC
jgi:serine/threonine protein kinase